MSGKIIFYHNPMSRGRVVHWMLEEVGAPYETRLLDFNRREHKSAQYLAINPMGKIPAIVHRDIVITEAPAICAYLADAFPEQGLAPALSDPKRGTYLRWFFFGSGCLEPAVIDKMLERPAASRPSAIGYGTYEETLNTLEKALSQSPFLLGERFSAVDLFISGQLGFGMMTKAIEPRPVFQAYHQRCTERPAGKRASSADEKTMKELKAKT